MERSTALKRLQKLLGKHLAYRVNLRAPSPEERAMAKSELPAAIAERDKLKEQRDARRAALLEADAEYQTLQSAVKTAGNRVSDLSGMTYSHKITVGTTMDVGGIGFFSVKAEGDSWEEVLDKLTKKEAV